MITPESPLGEQLIGKKVGDRIKLNSRGPGLVSRAFRPGAWALYLAPLVTLAFLEEWGWDRVLWHERPGLFPGAALRPGPEALALIIPLLAVPQATHYVLDGWIWRTRGNPGLRERLGF